MAAFIPLPDPTEMVEYTAEPTPVPRERVGLTADVGDVIAVAALLVAVLALARPWWQERKARIDVRMEEFTRADDRRGATGVRVVVVNHGPAGARDVRVELEHEGAPSTAGLSPLSRTGTPVLYAGEEHHITLMLHFGDQYPNAVAVEWSDGRWARQRRTFWPSLREI